MVTNGTPSLDAFEKETKRSNTFLDDGALEKFISKDNFGDKYSVEEDIASGHFATVKKCRNKKTGQEFAAKFVRKRRRGKTIRPAILNEIRIHKMISNHPRLISLHECYETASEIIMILEYAKAGELFKSLEDDFGAQDSMNESLVARIIKQVLDALTYLHDLNIVHLDIKPSNILLTEPLPHGDIKLCDFGLSRIINSRVETREMIGTPDYVAPEVLNYDALSTQTDMWSLGVLTYVMLTGHSPFSSTRNTDDDCEGDSSSGDDGTAGNDIQETYLNITMGNLDFPSELFDAISGEAVDFISKLCVVHPKKRMTTAQCFAHPWIRENVRDETFYYSTSRTLTESSSDLKESILHITIPRCEPLLPSSHKPLVLTTPPTSSISLVLCDRTNTLELSQISGQIHKSSGDSNSTPATQQISRETNVFVDKDPSPSKLKLTNPRDVILSKHYSSKFDKNTSTTTIPTQATPLARLSLPTYSSPNGKVSDRRSSSNGGTASHHTTASFPPQCNRCSIHCLSHHDENDSGGEGRRVRMGSNRIIHGDDGGSSNKRPPTEYYSTYYETKLPNLKGTISLMADSNDWQVENADGTCQLSFHTDQAVMSINIHRLGEQLTQPKSRNEYHAKDQGASVQIADHSPTPKAERKQRDVEPRQINLDHDKYLDSELSCSSKDWEHQSFHETSFDHTQIEFRTRSATLSTTTLNPNEKRERSSLQADVKSLYNDFNDGVGEGDSSPPSLKDSDDGGQNKLLKSPQCLINGKLYKQNLFKDRSKSGLIDFRSALTHHTSTAKQNQHMKEQDPKVGRLPGTSPSNWLRGRA